MVGLPIGLGSNRATVMAASLCGYPVFEALLINKCFSLTVNQVKLKETFVKTNCLKMLKQNENNDLCSYDLSIPHTVSVRSPVMGSCECLIISRFSSFSGRKVLVICVTYKLHQTTYCFFPLEKSTFPLTLHRLW